MKKIITILVFSFILMSCSVKEKIIFNEDGSGEFLTSFDLSTILSEMKEMGSGLSNSESKGANKKMDTTMVFGEILEQYKDSISQLSEEKQLIFNAVSDMFMTMKMDEEAGKMIMGIGMEFKSIEDLKGIKKKVKQAQKLNSKGEQIDMMKNQSPLGVLAGGDDAVLYNMTATSFSRKTIVEEKTEEEKEALESLFKNENEESDEMTGQILGYFKKAEYVVELVFPKKVKSVSIENAEISKDRKTVTYKTNWMESAKNPQSLDVDVTFYE